MNINVSVQILNNLTPPQSKAPPFAGCYRVESMYLEPVSGKYFQIMSIPYYDKKQAEEFMQYCANLDRSCRMIYITGDDGL